MQLGSSGARLAEGAAAGGGQLQAATTLRRRARSKLQVATLRRAQPAAGSRVHECMQEQCRVHACTAWAASGQVSAERPIAVNRQCNYNSLLLAISPGVDEQCEFTS